MDGIITLLKADFSANNIGKVNLLGSYTKKLLAKQTKYNIDSTEAVALDTYVKSLEAGGFIGGENPLLTVLMLPCLAAKRDELFFNIAKNDDGGYPVDWSPVDTSNYIQDVDGKGVYANATILPSNNDGKGFKLDTTDVFTAYSPIPGFSVINYLYDGITATNAATRNIAQCNSGVNFTFSGGGASLGVGSKTIATIEGANTVVNKGFYAVSYDGETLHGNWNGIERANIAIPTDMQGVGYCNTNFALLQGSSNNDVNANSSLIAFGKAMTADQLTTLKDLTDTLMSKLGI